MHGIIVRQKSHLRPRTPRQRIEAVTNRLGNALEHTAPHARRADINDEEVAGRLGRTDHVLGVGNVLDDSFAELWTLVAIASVAVFVEVTKVGGGDFVELGANVASPPAAVFEEGDEGVDVGATPEIRE